MTPYYERDGITIYCEDCLEIMPKLEIEFDAIIADLPYGTTACSWDTVIPLEPLWREYKRLIKANGAVVLFGSQPFTTDLIISNRKWFKYDWVWDKINPSGFLNVNIMPLRSHESVLVFGIGEITYNPQMANKPFYQRRRGGYIYEGKGMKHKGVYRDGLTNGNGFRGKLSNPISIITINKGGPQVKKKQLHPLQKPLDLMSYLIRTYTNPDELILDNSFGVGTTLVAAQNEGRRAVGIEISEKYCKVAVDRLRQPSFFSLPTNGKVKTEAQQLELANIIYE